MTASEFHGWHALGAVVPLHSFGMVVSPQNSWDLCRDAFDQRFSPGRKIGRGRAEIRCPSHSTASSTQSAPALEEHFRETAGSTGADGGFACPRIIGEIG